MAKGPRSRRVSSFDLGVENRNLPLVVVINGLDNCKWESDVLSGIAIVEHVGMLDATRGKIESAVAVIVQSLAFMPRGVQKRLLPTQLVVCVGSSDKSVDMTLADELGLRLVHVDISRADEVADTVMGLLLGLLRRTHSLASQGSACPEWLGGMQAVCGGMRRCRGMTIGLIGVNTAARAVARRAIGFGMRVLYFDAAQEEELGGYSRIRRFPSAAEHTESLAELLLASDIISLHCALTNDTIQLINEDTIKLVKKGAVIINTGSNHLLDDTTVKIALNEKRIGGIALDGVDGPSWLEAWVREMPNVLILPHSAEHSDEVWVEMRSKAAEIIRTYLLQGTMPDDFVIDELSVEDEILRQEAAERREAFDRWKSTEIADSFGFNGYSAPELSIPDVKDDLLSSASAEPSPAAGSEGQGSADSRPGAAPGLPARKGKKKGGKGHRKPSWGGEPPNKAAVEAAGGVSREVPPEVPRSASFSKQAGLPVPRRRSSDDKSSGGGGGGPSPSLATSALSEGTMIALRPVDAAGAATAALYAARQKAPGHGWCLDVIPGITAEDPSAQFFVVVKKDKFGLRSVTADGKLLQANKKGELVFMNHNFDAWEGWLIEGAELSECRLVNGKFRSVYIDVSIHLLAMMGGDDGVVRWRT